MIQNGITYVLLLLLRAYRYFISPCLGNRCRFYPSCSEYAQEALVECGLARGIWFTLRRLLRCHPFHPGGYDPLPQRKIKQQN
jgi:putative membrane protein insertion efficiency factor